MESCRSLRAKDEMLVPAPNPGSTRAGRAALPGMPFNFALIPLDELKPWGKPGEQRLHWFGLTDGQYGKEAGTSKLLEDSDTAQKRQPATRFWDYRVVRLYKAVARLDQMTQQNAALVEQSAAAAESLNDQAASLSHAVSTFKMT